MGSETGPGGLANGVWTASRYRVAWRPGVSLGEALFGGVEGLELHRRRVVAGGGSEAPMTGGRRVLVPRRLAASVAGQ